MGRNGRLLCSIIALLTLGCSENGEPSARAELVVAPQELAFGEVPVGAAVQQILRLKNRGSSRVRLEAVGAPEGFQVVPRTVEIASGGSAEVLVRFAPIAVGAVAGPIHLVSATSHLDAMIRVEGVGAEVGLELPSLVEFGDVTVGATGVRYVSVRNRTGTSLYVTASLEGSSAFSLERDGIELRAGSTASIAVVFRPDARGPHRAVVRLSACANCAAQAVELFARGVGPWLHAEHERLDFGAVPVGLDVEQAISVRNQGEDAVLLAATVEGGEGAFAIAGEDLPRPLPIGVEGHLTLRFAPSKPGVHGARLVWRDDSGRVLLEVPLSGTGGGPLVHPVPASLSFGDQVRARAVKRELMLENLGDPVPLFISSLSIVGAEASSFSLGNPSLPLDLAERTTVPIWFRGEVEGEHEAILVLETSSSAQPEVRIPLHGSAHVPTRCALVPEKGSIRYGLVGTDSRHTRTLRVTNEGAAPCLVWGMEISGGAATYFTASGSFDEVVALGPGENFTLELQFDPEGAPEAHLLQAQLQIRHGEREALHLLEVPLSAMVSSNLAVHPAPSFSAIESTPTDRAFLAAAELQLEIGGDFRLSFAEDSSPSFQLAPTQKWGRNQVLCETAPCQERLQVAFVPRALGEHHATLEIWIDEYGEPILVGLEGEGVAPCPTCDWPEPHCESTITVPMGESIELNDPWPHACHWGFGTSAALPSGERGARSSFFGFIDRDTPLACKAQGVPSQFTAESWIWSLRERPDGRAAYCARKVEVERPSGLAARVFTLDSEPLDYRFFILRGSVGDPLVREDWFDPLATCSGPDGEEPVTCPWGEGSGADPTITPIGARGTVLFHIPNPRPMETYYLGYLMEPAIGGLSGAYGTVWCPGDPSVASAGAIPSAPNTVSAFGLVSFDAQGRCSKGGFNFGFPYRPIPGAP